MHYRKTFAIPQWEGFPMPDAGKTPRCSLKFKPLLPQPLQFI